MKALPKAGEFVDLRGRLWLVEEQLRDNDSFPSLRLSCVDDDAQGETASVLWDAEIAARSRDNELWDLIGDHGTDDAKLFAAYLRTIRWNSSTASDRGLFQAPFRAGIRMDAYQLAPLKKALQLPRVNLLIADDVGLGKTIEAGLVVREMLLRKRIDFIVVLAPPSMTLQWQDELAAKFGLSFEIIDRDLLAELRRKRGFGVNPWAAGSRFILSHKLLGDEAYTAGLREVLGSFQARTLLILDEAHHCAPAGGGRYAIESQFTKAVRDIADRFEHRLFLSATPHNGHANSFATLLEILDPQRFTRGMDVREDELKPVMVRRLKADLRALGEAFPERIVERVGLGGLREDQPELVLAKMLSDYGALRERRIGELRAGKAAQARPGLCSIILSGGTIAHALKRLKWPGEAAVVVSVIHVVKGEVNAPTLDGRLVQRVSAYVVEGQKDDAPNILKANDNISFKGHDLLGQGFLFDDSLALKGVASPLAAIESYADSPTERGRIKPIVGGEELATATTLGQVRFAIWLNDLTLDEAKSQCPRLLDLVERLVRPDREKQKDPGAKAFWWKYLRDRPEMRSALQGKSQFLCAPTVSPHLAMAMLGAELMPSKQLAVFALSAFAALATLQSRVHEVWARFFASTLEDRLRYTPSDCFETFPLPPGYDSAPALEALGEAYHAHRADMMVATDKGMTKTYNRFHDPHDKAADIVELRRLHAMMDDAVLRAYGWADLANRAHPGDPANGIAPGEDAARFLTEDDEDDHKYQNRLFWPAPFRDELLARLLKLNEERAAAEKKNS